jgi:hypothetical protein
MAKTEIKSEISLNTTKFQRGLAKSQKGINNFAANAIKKFGAIAGAAGLGMLARSAIDLGSKISDMAVQMNIGTTELQVLDFAAREAGVGTEIMARALRNVQLRTEEAIKGNKSYGDAFVQLGINVNEFKKLKTEEKLEAIAIAQSKATDKAAAYNAVSRILGEKAGPALQEVLQNLAGPKGYGGLEAAAERANEIMGPETVAKMDAAADEIESFKRQMTVLAAEVLGFVIPAFQMFLGGLGAVSDMYAMLLGKAISFYGFIGRSVGTIMQPAIQSFAALARGAEAAGLAMSGNVNDARKAAKESVDLAKGAFETLKDVPEEIGKNWKRATEEMELDSAAFEKSTIERAGKMKEAWADVKGEKALALEDSGGGGGGGGGGGAATSAADTDAYFNSLSKEGKENFLKAKARQNPGALDNSTAATNANLANAAVGAPSAETGSATISESMNYAKLSSDSLKVIETELTRTS